MRCLACNEILTDNEATRRDKRDEFIDICYKCQPTVDVDDYEPDYDEVYIDDYSTPEELDDSE